MVRLRIAVRLCWSLAAVVSGAAACDGGSARESASTPSTDRLSDVRADLGSPAVEERQTLPQPALADPRRTSRHGLEPLWTVGGPDDVGRLIQPVHLFASRHGVLVSELDGAQVRVFDSRTGTQVDSIGRFGLGPGEFGRVPILLGTYNRPLAFEGPSGRISFLDERRAPVLSRVAAGHSWASACQVDANAVLLSFVGWDDDGYFVSTLGQDAALVDSFSHPIRSLQDVLPIGRQAAVYQADDSTCVILPSYAREFAVYRRGRIAIGVGVEPAPIPWVESPPAGATGSR